MWRHYGMRRKPFATYRLVNRYNQSPVPTRGFYTPYHTHRHLSISEDIELHEEWCFHWHWCGHVLQGSVGPNTEDECWPWACCACRQAGRDEEWTTTESRDIKCFCLPSYSQVDRNMWQKKILLLVLFSSKNLNKTFVKMVTILCVCSFVGVFVCVSGGCLLVCLFRLWVFCWCVCWFL